MSESSQATALFEKLAGATEEAVATLESRSSKPLDLEAQFAAIQQKFEEASQLSDPTERDSRLRILESELSQLRTESVQEEQDLAQAVFGLNAMLESMGAEYQGLLQLNLQEQGLMNEAQSELQAAKDRRQKADSKWFFKDSAIRESEQAIKAAEQKVAETEREVNRLARQRLLKADIEQSLQEFMLRVEKTIDIMQHRMSLLDEQIEVVAARKAKAFEVKEEAAKALQELDKRLNEFEQSLQREEELLKVVESGTPEHAAATKRISDLRTDVERVRGERNGAFVIHQSKDKFATELSIHEKTQLKLRDNQRMWILSLKSDTEERVVTFRSRLEAMKAASDQDVAKTLDDLGSEVDQRNAEYMAKLGIASDKRRMEKIEKHPERIAKMAEVAAAQAEAIQQIRMREAKAIEEFKRQYGIDPTASSFFHYQGNE